MQRLLRNFIAFSFFLWCLLFVLEVLFWFFFFWDRLFCNCVSGFHLAILLPQLLRAGMTGEHHLIQVCLPLYNCPTSSLEVILCWWHALIWTIPMPTDGRCLVRTHGEHVAEPEVGIDAQLSGPLLLSDAFPRQNKLRVKRPYCSHFLPLLAVMGESKLSERFDFILAVPHCTATIHQGNIMSVWNSKSKTRSLCTNKKHRVTEPPLTHSTVRCPSKQTYNFSNSSFNFSFSLFSLLSVASSTKGLRNSVKALQHWQRP